MPSPSCLRLALLVLATLLAHAHSVWIEPDANGQLIVRFAEPDGKFERSPGHLDSLAPVTGWTIGASNAPVAVEAAKKSDHFLLTGAKPGVTAGVEAGFAVMGAEGRPGRRPIFYARWHPADAGGVKPALTLDIVPTGKDGEVRVWFRGQPLGNIKATLRLPDESEKEVTADAEGFIRFETPQSGQYHLSIGRHRETLPGFADGRAYELTSHNAALTWRKP